MLQVLIAFLALAFGGGPQTSTGAGDVFVVRQDGAAIGAVAVVGDALLPLPLLAVGCLRSDNDAGGFLGSNHDTYAPGDTGPEQTITTTIDDPGHPGQPWVVTTYRLPDESDIAFVMRHRDMIKAVRAALD